MVKNALLVDLIEEFEIKIKKSSGEISRSPSFAAIPNKIQVIIGMRRTGKTHFLFQLIHELFKKNIPLSQILYLNFEDDRLLPLTQEKLPELIDSFYTLHPENHDKTCYLFLDEIQNVDGWAVVVRRYFDTKNVKLFLTGSSSKLLSKEIATSLRGRSISIEIWPFNFNEYLSVKKIHLNYQKNKSKRDRDILLTHLKAYLKTGGFPEAVLLSDPDRIELLQNYVNVVILRDIIERHNITHISLIKYMIKTLLKNIGGSFSVNKFSHDVKSQGFSVAKNTIYDYVSYIEDAYLAFMVPLYSESVRKVQTNPKKIYAVDTGLSYAYTLHRSENMGHFFENLIYLDLRRSGHEIYYYLTQERYEVDFLTKDREGNLNLFQVVWDISDTETLERETRALRKAEEELGIKGKIITPENYYVIPA